MGLGNTTATGFMVTGVDEAPNMFTTPDGTFESGYWIGVNQTRFSMNAELINYRDRSTSVYVTAETEYLEGRMEQFADASMSLMSVTG